MEARAGRTLLLTGRPGVGKTTAVRRVVELLEGRTGVRGFCTEEVRERGRRVGFRGVPFGGGFTRDETAPAETAAAESATPPTEAAGAAPAASRLIAHVDFGPPRVSRYGVDVEAVDALTRDTLEPEPGAPAGGVPPLYVVDEIGKMECFSERFVAAVRRLLEERRPLLGTVSRSGGGFMEEARERLATAVWEVTRESRDRVPERAVDWFRGRAWG